MADPVPSSPTTSTTHAAKTVGRPERVYCQHEAMIQQAKIEIGLYVLPGKRHPELACHNCGEHPQEDRIKYVTFDQRTANAQWLCQHPSCIRFNIHPIGS